MCGVHDTVALELHPDSIDPGPRKHELEFDARPSVIQERMLVHHVDRATRAGWTSLITKWVDGGIRRGNNPDMLPRAPEFKLVPASTPDIAARVSGRWVVDRPFTLDGLIPEKLSTGQSFQIVARMPGGKVEPLLWLHAYDQRYPHAFLLRRPIALPAGAVIEGVPPDAVVALIRA
jgi:hypothetical protein